MLGWWASNSSPPNGDFKNQEVTSRRDMDKSLTAKTWIGICRNPISLGCTCHHQTVATWFGSQEKPQNWTDFVVLGWSTRCWPMHLLNKLNSHGASNKHIARSHYLWDPSFQVPSDTIPMPPSHEFFGAGKCHNPVIPSHPRIKPYSTTILDVGCLQCLHMGTTE